MKFYMAFCSFLFAGIANLWAQQTFTAFLQNNKPNTTPSLFAPNIVSTSLSTRDLSVSPDGTEIYYTIQNQKLKFAAIVCLKKVGTKWKKAEVAPFSGTYSDLEPFVSPDGKRLFFSSNRPSPASDKVQDYNLWVTDRLKDDSWGLPQYLGSQINTDKDEFYPSVALNGNLYFTATRTEGQGKEDIYFSRFNKETNTYGTPEPLPNEINTETYEFNAYISPDESYLIFSSFGRKDDLGGGDLYFSLRKNNQWIEAVHFEEPVNSNFLDYCPYADVKNKVLYFTSNRHNHQIPAKPPLTIESINHANNQTLNGYDNVYWLTLPKEFLK